MHPGVRAPRHFGAPALLSLLTQNRRLYGFRICASEHDKRMGVVLPSLLTSGTEASIPAEVYRDNPPFPVGHREGFV